MSSITWTTHRYYGSDRPWIARISGRDKQYGLAREFLRPAEQTRSRSGATDNTTYVVLEPGLYELRLPRRNKDDGGFRIVRVVAGEMRAEDCSVQRAHAIAALLDDGACFDAACAAQ